MKYLPLTTLLLLISLSCTEMTTTVEEVEKSDNEILKDSLEIMDPNLTIDPFSFGENPLDSLTSFDEVNMDFKTFNNRHVEGQIDTLFQIVLSSDTFKVYKNASKNWLVAANIHSEQFSTNQGIHIGMTKTEMRKQLNSNENFPDFVRIHNLEVLEWIDFAFQDEKLIKMDFKGYMD